MSPTRRQFVHQASALGLLAATRPGRSQQMHGSMSMAAPAAPSDTPPAGPPPAMLHCLELAPFVDPLPLPVRLDGRHPLDIAMREVHCKLHRDVAPTRLWVFAEASDDNPQAVGPVIEARSQHPLQVTWSSHLPTRHFLPIDHSLHGCGPGVPDVRTVTHLHGARVQSRYDGYPDDWFIPGQARTCHYPLQQDACSLWYHDHAMGLNRLNTYAGLFGQALVRDPQEEALHLPSGLLELPLTLYDRDFTADGQLFYPRSADPRHAWVPEFSGDAILINGKIRPYHDVQPRLYRLRLLNAANSRFFTLSLSTGEPLLQIGSDQGLLPAAVPVPLLVLAPGERADVLLDLTAHAGHAITLRTGAFDILQFRVGARTQALGTPSFRSPVRAATALRTVAAPDPATATVTRTITLNEYQDEITRPMIMLLNRQRWHEPTTEKPRLNTTEIWEFVNLTEDTHPMHLHLVRFQLLDRRVFEPYDYLMYKKLRFTAPALPPEANEHGWKDVIQCPAAMVTRILVHFDGYPGKYLYHCHILEHEANDMMRPFEVVA